MCGIIGYIGNRNTKEVLVAGLKNLEYRGYDSSGIAIKNDSQIQIIKATGKISNLEKKLNQEKLIDSNMGIAHTRWATHGKPTEENAHPHQVGNVVVVHNGIIENMTSLKKQLQEENVNFKTETDTEVIAALINKYYEEDPVEAISKAMKKLVGSYALGILFKDKNELYAVREKSPLIIGVGNNENFIASDISAIIDYTNKYILLDEFEIAKITKNEVIVIKDNKIINKKIETSDITKEAKDKNGYKYYMLKEIMEEPVVLEKTLEKYLSNKEELPDISSYEEIHIVACGSAMYAGLIGKSLLSEYANKKVIVEVASEYRYQNIIYDRKTLVILISQSGETADTISAMRKAKENNIDTLAIVNVKTSTIARESDKKLYIEAGPEIAVATTKAYILQVAVLSLLALKATKSITLEEKDNIIEEIKNLPKMLKNILDKKQEYFEIAKKIYKEENIFFIGRKIDYAICMEGSLKLKEVSYIHSEAYQAGELKHGTISLIEENTVVFAVITEDDIKDKTISNIKEVMSRGAKIFIISNDTYQAKNQVTVPKINVFMQPILVVPILQLIAFETARLRNCDIDKPKNLAKSVTVE